MSIASNSNSRSLRNHSDAQSSPDETAAKLDDCSPAERAAYEAAMSKSRQQDSYARKFSLPRPPQPQLADFVAANGGENSNPEGVRANGHHTAEETQLDSGAVPANDNLPKVPSRSDGEADTEAAQAKEQIIGRQCGAAAGRKETERGPAV